MERRRFLFGQQQQPMRFDITDLDTHNGCTPGCAVLTQSELDGEQQFVIANSTGIFSYVGDDKRLALGIEGDKLAIYWWFNYLITVTKETKKTPIITSTIPTPNPTTTDQPQQLLSRLMAG
jgi:hypothetical protein